MSSCECVAKDIEGLLKFFFTSYLDYNQIWLNGLEDDPLLFYIFLCIAYLAPKLCRLSKLQMCYFVKWLLNLSLHFMYSGAMVFGDVYICNLGGQQAWKNFEIVSRKSRSLLRALGQGATASKIRRNQRKRLAIVYDQVGTFFKEFVMLDNTIMYSYCPCWMS